jgi:predicted phosphodiesterase
MRNLLRFLLLKPILWLVEKFSSAPDRERIFDALSTLRERIKTNPGKKGFVIPFDMHTGRYIIFSDQHRGRKNGADDFVLAEPNYLKALEYYNQQRYHLICLGDSEELWENSLLQTIKHNKASFEAEKQFALRNAFTKIFGNHDLDWDMNPLAPIFLKEIYSVPIIALEGITLQTTINNTVLNIFCTHGHQGDLQSDGNWFSKFFVSKIWAPLQSFLRINPNTPAYDKHLKTSHNRIMYEWSSLQKNLILITGHTHQPVFQSLTHFERLQRERKKEFYNLHKERAESLDLEIEWKKREDNHIWDDFLTMKPCYFNSGCCCFEDGDITGIEIADGNIRLIRWKYDQGIPQRSVLEESTLEYILRELEN